MTLNAFLEKIVEQFDDTPAEMIVPDLDFRSLEEWDSLSALSVIAMIDEEYEVQLSGEDMRSVSTLIELFNLVKSKM